MAALVAAVEVKGATLMKRSRNRSLINLGVNWQLRRISMTETKITYGTPDGPPKDFLMIDTHTVVSEWEGDGKEHAFRLQSGKDELILQAASAEDRKEWMEAIRKVANPPPLPSTGDPVKDAANRAQHAAQLEAQRAADEAALRLKDAAKGAAMDALEHGVGSMGMPSMGSLGVSMPSASGIGGALLGAGAAALENAAKEKAAALLKEQLEKKAAEEAEAARQVLLAKVRVPVACEKKVSNESAYQQRFVWINSDTKEFHWAKTADVSKSKCINIKTHCKSVGSVGDVGAHNFSIELKDHEAMFSKMFGSVPSSIDVKMADADLNNAFIAHIKELMV